MGNPSPWYSSTIQLPSEEAYVNIGGFRMPLDPSGGNTFQVPDMQEGRISFEAGFSRYEIGNLGGRFWFEASGLHSGRRAVDFIERGRAVVRGPLELTNLGDGRVHVRVVPPPPPMSGGGGCHRGDAVWAGSNRRVAVFIASSPIRLAAVVCAGA